MLVFVRWVVVLIGGGLVVGDGCKINMDSFLYNSRECVNVDMNNDVHCYSGVVIGRQG